MSYESYIEAKNVELDFLLLDAAKKSITNQLLSFVGRGSGGEHKSNSTFRALQNINFKFETGSRIGIWGANGAGKSSLLRLMAGIYQPSNGSFYSSGKIASFLDIGLGIMPDATGRENIYTRGILWGLTKTEIEAKFQSIVDFSELEDFIEMPVRTYSSGMQMRLALAVALSVEADIILMDEWLSVGDEAFQIKSEKYLTEKVRRSDIFCLATHSKELIGKLTDQVILMDHGKIRAIVPTADFLAGKVY